MALVLLIGAGLMIRSLLDLWNVNPGFNPRGVLTFAVSLSPSLGTNATTSRNAIREMDERLRNIPGVESRFVHRRRVAHDRRQRISFLARRRTQAGESE